METSPPRPLRTRIAGRLDQLDDAGLRRTSHARRRWLTRLIVPYTSAGTIGLPWIVAGIAVGHAPAVVLAVAAAAVAAGLLKLHWRRRRPDIIPRLIRRQRTASFPSGHAATGAAAACTLIVVAPALTPVWIGMAALMALSRVYVGVHWPTDVAAGVGLGVLVVLLPLATIAAI